MIKYRAFTQKYHTKKITQLEKITNSSQWIIVDIRPHFEWTTSHIKNSINIPHNYFTKLSYQKIRRNQTILLVSQTGRAHLELYQWLTQHNFKVYILLNGWQGIYLNEKYDHLVIFDPS